MKLRNLLGLLASILLISSCYNAQITTGAQPSDQIIDKPWAHSFVFGLVPPDEVSAASQCTNGVAKVETQISFLNGLVSAITFNIYTPMHITVTCAAGSALLDENDSSDSTIVISREAENQQVIEEVQKAARLAASSSMPVILRFQ